MRYVVYGAGAIGGVVGARLFQRGHEVVLVARGAHAEAIRRQGLRFETPDGVERLPIPVVDQDLSEVDGSVVVFLAVKSQDTAAAVDRLAASGRVAALVCLQNGVANERMALRHFAAVYGVCVMLPAAHLEPGVVTLYAAPLSGILDLGRFPAGTDDGARELAQALSGATFLSEARPDIMRWKYRKLVMNLGNAVQALCGSVEADDPVLVAVRREADLCFAAAGIDVATEVEDRARRADHIQRRPVPGRPRSGGSSYQSLARHQGTIETDYLNGEICLLGRLHGVPTPANLAVQSLANRAAREGWDPGRLTPADLSAAVADLTSR